MGAHPSAGEVCVGVIANPHSARDIRRVVSNAGNLQIADRVNALLRLMAALAQVGVPRVLLMPDNGGIRAMLLRRLPRERQHVLPEVQFLPMEPSSTVEDTHLAARLLRQAGAKAIIVLGGDGTHRAVVRECRDIPIAGISSGTNNAFPEMRESTVTALAVGLYATGRLEPPHALVPNKLLDVSVGGRRDIALVDAVVSSEQVIGSRALWKTDQLAALYLSFAEPQAVGLSAIGGLLHPVGRRDPMGLAVQLSDALPARRFRLRAPIAPGLVRDIGIAHWEAMPPAMPFRIAQQRGVIALDGERELVFGEDEPVTISLRENAFFTVDVTRCLHIAARQGLLRHSLTHP